MSHHVVLTWVVLTRGTAGILDINPLTAAKKQELSCSFPKTTACKTKVMIAVTSTLRQDKCSQDTVGYHSDFHQSIRYIYIYTMYTMLYYTSILSKHRLWNPHVHAIYACACSYKAPASTAISIPLYSV